MGPVRHIPLGRVAIDPAVLPPAAMPSEGEVAAAAAALWRGESLPACVVVEAGGRFVLVVGAATLLACREAGRDLVPCRVHVGSTDDARAVAAAQAMPSVPMPIRGRVRDRVRAALVRCGGLAGNRVIARSCGCGPTTVARVRAELEAAGDLDRVPPRTRLRNRRRWPKLYGAAYTAAVCEAFGLTHRTPKTPHKRPLPPLADRQAAVRRVLVETRGEMADHATAKAAGVSIETVRRWRVRLAAAGESVRPRSPRRPGRSMAERRAAVRAEWLRCGGRLTVGAVARTCRVDWGTAERVRRQLEAAGDLAPRSDTTGGKP